MQTRTDEIADGIYRISTFVARCRRRAGSPSTSSCVDAEEPLLYHTGMRQLFPLGQRGGRRRSLPRRAAALDRVLAPRGRRVRCGRASSSRPRRTPRSRTAALGVHAVAAGPAAPPRLAVPWRTARCSTSAVPVTGPARHRDRDARTSRTTGSRTCSSSRRPARCSPRRPAHPARQRPGRDERGHPRRGYRGRGSVPPDVTRACRPRDVPPPRGPAPQRGLPSCTGRPTTATARRCCTSSPAPTSKPSPTCAGPVERQRAPEQATASTGTRPRGDPCTPPVAR